MGRAGQCLSFDVCETGLPEYSIPLWMPIRDMYIIDRCVKNDPVRRWALPDRVFFACGACHILAFAFLEKYPHSRFRPVWIKPLNGHAGNHIFVTNNDAVFDYHGYSDFQRFLAHTKRRANKQWPGWSGELVELPKDVLISEKKSRQYDGLWLREPQQFLHDALPRARQFVMRFPAPAAVTIRSAALP